MNNAPVMPTFDLQEVTDEDVIQLSKTRGTKLQPGLYAFEITEAAFVGAAEKDDTWFKLHLTLAITDGASLKESILVPTKAFTYGEKNSVFPLSKLRTFLESIGESNDIATLRTTLPKLMVKGGAKLVGRKGEAKLDFTANHIEKVEDKICILDKKGKPLMDDTKTPYQFDDFDSARLFCESEKISTFGFVKVVEYVAPAKQKKVSGASF